MSSAAFEAVMTNYKYFDEGAKNCERFGFVAKKDSPVHEHARLGGSPSRCDA